MTQEAVVNTMHNIVQISQFAFAAMKDFVLSAYEWCGGPYARKKSIIGAAYIKKSNRPRTEPWGTPRDSGTQVKVSL